MKKLLLVIASAALIGSASVMAATDTTANQPNIAVVNVQQLFQQSPRIAELNKKLQNQFKGRQDDLSSAQKSLQEEVDKYKKDAATMTEKEKDSLQKKIVADQSALSKKYSDFQQDLSKEQNKIMKSVLAQLNDVIKTLAKKNNYLMVLDAQAVIYSAGDNDITKQVQKEFDNK
jgi:outer membrane protein